MARAGERTNASRSAVGRRVALLWFLVKANAPWRKAFPRRSVRRVVQGVELWLPWSHRLPEYAGFAPDYGQNLVRLAAALAPPESATPVTMIDVGANIGDSVKQILHAANAHVLAIEADPYYLGYLERNVGDLPQVRIAPVLLTTEQDDSITWAPSRRSGTTHFVSSAVTTEPAVARDASATVSVGQLMTRYPAFADARLIKSDTDGHDTELVPALARAFRDSRPVLFFEFDPLLTRRVAGRDAHQVWAELAGLGYNRVGLWSHDGRRLAQTSCEDAAVESAHLLANGTPATAYLDAVVVHSDDPAGQAALAELFA